MMRFYNQQHRFYCGVDLHARTLSLCILDDKGTIVRQQTIAAGTPLGVEPAALKGRWGGTDEFLGRGSLLSQSSWSWGPVGRPLDKCLVQRHADALRGKLPAAVSAAV